ncbi:MAG: TrkH family potassium uptake protein [Pleomorphochaeta sp.]
MNIKQDIRIIAIILLAIGATMLIPLFIGLNYGEDLAVKGFFFAILSIIIFSGSTLFLTKNHTNNEIKGRDGYLVVTLTWITITAFGALPLIISKEFSTYDSAYFEIMSGFTTTGATCFTNIEGAAKSILFWRSFTNWLGGMGVVVLFVALLPAMGIGGSIYLMGAESVGPVKGKLTPKTKNTAAALWSIYFGFTVLETILLRLGGLSLYEATTVAFSTMSAAGFCVKNTSIGSFNSAYVDVVVTIFMMASGANFALYFKLIKRKFSEVWGDGELKSYLRIWGICTLLCAFYLTYKGYYTSFFTSLRFAAFQLASVITTTGFATTDYLLWPRFSMMFVLVMMFIGGCAGSAGGGMKVIRVSTIVKQAHYQMKSQLHPNGVFPIKSGNQILSKDVLRSISAFCGVYIATWIFSSVLISLTGVSVETCLASTLLTLGNIGIGFGAVGPTGNFASFPNWAHWIFSFLMLIGRLEIFSVFILFTKEFWKK